MKKASGIIQRTLDGLFNSRVVSFFQSMSGYTPMADGFELDGVRVVKDGVVTLCVVDLGLCGLALVDTGYDRNGVAVLRELRRRGVGVESVKAILLTHGHIDHIGAAGLFPRAEVMALSEDVDLAEGRARSRGALSRLLPPNDTGFPYPGTPPVARRF
jgi:glyoxylase-like metal-dependent hydrolase (beta-lactamase superfamily II)